MVPLRETTAVAAKLYLLNHGACGKLIGEVGVKLD